MLNQLKKYLIVFGILLFLVIVLGCKKEKKSQPQQFHSPLVLQIVHDENSADFIEERKKAFEVQNNTIPGKRPLRIELIPVEGPQAAKDIASGKLKIDGWLAPSTTFINLANASIKNLGAKVGGCAKLFGTPVVIAASKATSNLHKGRSLFWKSILHSEKSGKEKEGKLKHISVSFPSPTDSSVGLAILIQLGYFASGHIDEQISLESLEKQETIDRLKTYERLSAWHHQYSSPQLQKTANMVEIISHYTLTTERELANFNSKNKNNLVAYYPEEGSYWQDYSLCYSEAPWVNSERRTGIKQFAKFLGTVESQTEVKQHGFRPLVQESPLAEPLTPRFGVSYSLPRSSLPPVEGKVVKKLLGETWPAIKRQDAVAILLDTSGSTDGEILIRSKGLIRDLIDRISPKSLISLITFSANPKVEVRFTEDRQQIQDSLRSLTARGGSALYDGINVGLSLLREVDSSKYRKTLVLVTDGQDKNSFNSLVFLTSAFKKLLPKDLDVFLIGINDQTADFSDLKEIAAVSNGDFLISKSANLYTSTKRLRDHFEGKSKY